ncbi:hypothetical protein BJ170DRAFT_465972 [Xylariales sp. AK1849]|nr:hypothetical protein BJ170DRAFT_465972 [Xylariales sp. AK1849]
MWSAPKLFAHLASSSTRSACSPTKWLSYPDSAYRPSCSQSALVGDSLLRWCDQNPGRHHPHRLCRMPSSAHACSAWVGSSTRAARGDHSCGAAVDWRVGICGEGNVSLELGFVVDPFNPPRTRAASVALARVWAEHDGDITPADTGTVFGVGRVPSGVHIDGQVAKGSLRGSRSGRAPGHEFPPSRRNRREERKGI